MAVVTETIKIRPVILLNIGVTTSGEVKTATVSLPAVNKTAYEANTSGSDQKVINIVNACSPCFSQMVYSVKKTVESRISES